MIPAALTKNKYLIATALLLIAVIVCVWPFLSLPYYWDESWVYGKGVRIMCMEGPGMLPTAVPVDISRGHPLLFYFLGGLWLKVSGNTIFSSHLFALTISVILVFGVYKLCADFLSKRHAFFVAALLMLQPIFLGQSCLVLPEMMLAMWTVFSLWAFYSGKKLLYILFGAFMLLTKESGLVCILAIGLNELLFDLF
jgi:4-amino-4-deoxy-L-arabinose transferase-like glycosyltransferase